MPRNPFSQRPEGPCTAAERAVYRAARERENASSATLGELEHIPTILDVRKYLENKFEEDAGKTDLCRYPFGCDIDRLEPILLAELVDVKASDAPDPKHLGHLRSMIRAASYFTHLRPIATELIPFAESLVEEVQAHQQELARLEPEEAKDWDDIREAAQSVVNALQRGQKGEEAEPAALAVEYFLDRVYQQKKYSGYLKKMRELRDQIYFQRLYPGWFEAGTEGLMKKSVRPRS